MFLQGNWAYPMIKKINPDIDLLFMPFPADDEDGAKVVAKIDATLGISASCRAFRQRLENFWIMYFQRISVNIMQKKLGHTPV